MEQSNNKNIIIALLVVIVLILGGLCILFATGKLSFNSNKEDKKDIVEPADEAIDLTGLPEWAQYVLNQDITSITYTKPKDYATDYSECEEIEITKKELAEIFREISKYELRKSNGGLGFASACNATLGVRYDGKAISILNGLVFGENRSQNDPEFLKLLDKEAKLIDAGNGYDEYYYAFAYLPLDQIVNDALNK